MPDAGTILVLILVPIWAFGSGILLNWPSSEKAPETPSDQFTDTAVGCFGTVLWVVQLALMGMSMRLSWFTPLISIPASVVFYSLGTEISEQRNKKDELSPFFETWVVVPVTEEQRTIRLRTLYKKLLVALASYFLLLIALAYLRYLWIIPLDSVR